MEKEVFKKIEELPDYTISNYGRVKTITRKIRYTHSVTGEEFFRQSEERFLKEHHNSRTGYKFVQLYKDKKMYNRSIHRLVATTFHPLSEIIDGVVNHKDGNKHNNYYRNLEWCTDSYNHEHATKTGLKARGEEIGSSKLNSNMVHAIKWFLKKGYSHSELSMAFKISRPSISLIHEGKSWKHIALTGEELTIK